jgi:hypothetical protein
MRISRQLVLLGTLAVLCLCVSSTLANNVVDDMEMPAVPELVLERRQNDNGTAQTTSESSKAPSTTAPPPSSTTPTTKPTTTPPSTTTPSTTPTPTSDGPKPTTSQDQPTPTPSTTSDKPTPTTTTQKLTPTTKIVTMTYTTRVNNQDAVVTATTSSVEMVTPTSLSSNGDSNSGGGGLSTSQKNIVIGVVVGVGGAIILGGLAIFLWRLRAKRNEKLVDEADLISQPPMAVPPGANANSNMFQNNLDQYHKPPGQVNMSSNF